MTEKFILYGLLFLCNLSTIAQEKMITKVHFPYTADIKSKSFSVPDVVFGKTPSLVVTNNYLIILRTYTEPLFHVFNLPDCNYIGGFGNLGKGSNDFELPDARTSLKTNNGFKVFDHHNGFMYIDMSNYRENKTYEIKILKVPGELYILNDAIQLNDHVIIGMPEDWKTKKQNVRYNIQTKNITYFGEYPNIFPERYRHIYWGAFWRHSVAKSDGSMFASFYDGVKMFRIYDYLGNIKIEKVIKVFNLFEGNSFRKETKAYYKVVRANNQYIYALCLDVMRKNYIKSFPSLEIWNWKGEPVARLNLDHHIQSFDITSDGKSIYAMDREIDDKIFVYELGDVLK